MNIVQKPKVFILDVDGVMTTGHFIYSADGKKFKIFGPDDNDGLALLNNYLKIIFVTGDKKGYSISKKRISEDMGYELYQVSTIKRIDWIRERFKLDEVIYMGDGIFDHYVMKKVLYGISPNNGDILSKEYSNYITRRNGGDRAVAEACLHILSKFFVAYNPDNLPNSQNKFSEWAI